MFRTLLTGLAAVGLLAAGSAAAEARTHVDFNIGIGLPLIGGYEAGGYYAPPPPPVAVYVPAPPPPPVGYWQDEEDSCAPVIVGYRSEWSYRFQRYVRRPVWDNPC